MASTRQGANSGREGSSIPLRVVGRQAGVRVPDLKEGMKSARRGGDGTGDTLMAYAAALLDKPESDESGWIQALRFRSDRAADGATETTLDIAPEDLVELHYADGVVLWTSGSKLQEDLGNAGTVVHRSAAGAATLQAADFAALRGDGPRRGGGAGVEGLLRYRVAGAAAKAFRSTEDKRANAEGLYVVSPFLPRVPEGDGRVTPPMPGERKDRLSHDDGKPCLLFIHGTFSSFHGSYGALGEVSAGSGAGVTPLSRLHNQYGARVYAYEHATATRSVLENVARLAAVLDENVVLDVVSYSRGGLVAELLGRGELETPFDHTDAQLVASSILGRSKALASVQERGDYSRLLGEAVKKWWNSSARSDLRLPAAGKKPDAAGELAATLRAAVPKNPINDKAFDFAAQELCWLALAQQQLLRAKPQLRRQVRVAAPISGTSLADGRLDHWLSGLVNLILKAFEKKAQAATGGLVGLALTPLFDLLAGFAADSIDIENLRGLASMRAGNAEPLLATAEHVRLQRHTDARLLSISSDFVSGDGWAGILQGGLDWLSERFFGGPNDLVVNTQAMTAGLARPEACVAKRHFRRDGLIHINYFTFDEVCTALLSHLAGEEPAAAGARGARRAAAHVDPRLGHVIVIPGIGGSELSAGGRKIWLDYRTLALEDGLAALAGQRDGRSREAVAVGEVSAAYRPLVEHLEYAGFEVETFAYDWTRDLHHAGEALERCVARLKDRGVPLHFVAHSTGGLLLRALAGRKDSSLWREIMTRSGRALMLGTPNHGSWAIVELLAGNSRVIRTLAKLNPWLDEDAVRRSFAGMTGVLQLLPRLDPGHTYRQLDLVPADRIVDANLRRSELVDSVTFQRQVAYIAGQAGSTPDGTASGSPDGDGRVLWSDGPLPEQPVRYAPGVSHGNLISDKTVLNEISSYLRDGTWPRLGTAKPPARSDLRDGSAAVARKLPIDSMLPPEDLVAALLGATNRGGGETADTATAASRLIVTTSHGNLVHAIYPIVLGHYLGDGLYSTERTLDERLEGRLSESLRLRLYPGVVGSAQVFLDDSRRPTGAVVVGLGEVGELSPGKVRQSFSRGVRELSQSLFQQQTGADYGAGFDLYTVLIGSTGESLSVTESIESILYGALDANSEIERGNERRNPRQLRSYPRLARLHFIELWADRAHAMRSELRKLTDTDEFRHRIDVRPDLIADRGRQKRLFAQEDIAWWRRLLIQCDSRGHLRFKALTDRARMMSVVRPTQSNLVSLLIEQMTLSGANDPRLGRTLHELLIPNEFKERQSDDRPIVLVLDAKSAAYPWELLIDPKAPDGVARSVRQGVIRQLKTTSFTDQPLADQRNILVIGDTDSGLAALPGATAEAITVANTFRNASGWPEPTLLNRPRATEVLAQLFAQSWRVLHFAAHGVHDYREPVCAQCGAKSAAAGRGKECPVVLSDPRKYCANTPRSGMVLGPGLYLTPVEISQMRVVPEFVFLNCCYLAHSDGEQVVSGLSRLGANLATQLIQMGVRAVIAAGWAVGDAAADVFARVFYDSLLAGATFGDATRTARAACLRLHPDDNTWGAYQCYGDPAWRLDINGRRRASVGDWSGSPRAAYAEFYNVQRRGEVCRVAELEGERERYAKLVQDIESHESSWLHRPDIAGARARAALALALDDLVEDCLVDARRGDAVNIAFLQRTEVESQVRRAFARCLGAASSPQGAQSTPLPSSGDCERELGQRIEALKPVTVTDPADETAAAGSPVDKNSAGHVERGRLLLRLNFARAWINGGADPAHLLSLETAARDFAEAHGPIEIKDRVHDGLRDLRCNNARLYQLGAGLLLVLRGNDAGPAGREAALSAIKAEIQTHLDAVRDRAEDRNDYRFIAHFASLRILLAIAQDNLDETDQNSRGRSEATAILETISATLDRGVPHVQLQRSIDWVAFMRDLHPDASMRETLDTLYDNAHQRLDKRGEARLLVWRSRREPVVPTAEPVVVAGGDGSARLATTEEKAKRGSVKGDGASKSVPSRKGRGRERSAASTGKPSANPPKAKR